MPKRIASQQSAGGSDAHGALSDLYRSTGGVHHVFSQRVADYVAARPDYPQALFDGLALLPAVSVPALPVPSVPAPSVPAPSVPVPAADASTQGASAALMAHRPQRSSIQQSVRTQPGATPATATLNALRARRHHWVDVGAGTGLLSQGLLARGFEVTAIEPSAEMRAAAEGLLGSQPGYRSLAGSAEALPLAAGCADGIAAAQAFHWFEPQCFRAECLRVLKPQGQVALIWNDRLDDDLLQSALAEVFDAFGGQRREAMVNCGERSGVLPFFGSTVPASWCWPHQHRLSEDGLLSLALSRSYMPGHDSPDRQAAIAAIRQIFKRFAHQGAVLMRYQTLAYIGRPS